jgi:dipeptidyl aminopeptidase/acylaminoacyl peptidase
MPASGVTDMSYPISKYLRVTKAYHPTIAHDDRRLAYITDHTGVPQIFKVTLKGDLNKPSLPNQVTHGNERILGCWLSPASGDERMIFAQDHGGDEYAQLYLISQEERNITPLTKGFERAMHIFGEWSSDGSQFLFAANRRHPGLFNLYTQTIDGETQMVWQNEIPGFLYSISFSPDGQRAALVHMASSFQHNLLEIDLTNHSASLISPPDETARYAEACYSSDGKALFLNTDLDADFMYIARLDLETFNFEPIITADWDIENMAISPDRRLLAYTINVEGNDQLKAYNFATNETKTAPLPEGAPGVIAQWDKFITFSPLSRHVVFSFTSAIRTDDIHIWNLDSDMVHQVTHSSHGGVPKASFVAPELIRFPTFDKRQIPAWFYKPQNNAAGPWPVIVYVHGGPEAQFTPYFNFLIQYSIAHGYAILAPNVRGSTGYGKAYSHLDDVEKRMDSVADLAHAAHWLKEQPEIDGGKLVVYGGSYGGFMVLAAMTHYPDLWAAGVNLVGISNFVTFLENTSLYRRTHREAEYGSLEKDRQFLENIAPINHIDKIGAPLMVVHGANDPRVPLSEAEQLVEGLKARNILVEFLVMEDEGHGIVKRKNKKVVYPAIVKFLEKYVEHPPQD